MADEDTEHGGISNGTVSNGDVDRGNLENSDSSEDSLGATPSGPEKQSWGNKVEFLFSCISYAVGIGNLWRFPYLAQDNGGGTFLIPYLIMLVIEGMPLFYLEMSVGQLMRKGVIGSWTVIHPCLAGLGYAAVMTSFLVGIYYNVIIVWAFFYLFSSFQSPLPWNNNCSAALPAAYDLCKNASSKFFYYRQALDVSESIEDPGPVNWKLCLILLMAWLLIFAVMAKGVKAQGKVVYFTTLYPYVILLVLFIRGVMLDGASKGIEYLFKPDWAKLYDPDVWRVAATQIFYSLGLGFGGLVAYASYNKEDNDTFKDSILITLVNSGTSIFGAVTIFAILGHLAEINGIRLEDVGGGPGLAFIAFSEGLTLLVPSTMWSIFFFLMLLCLGVGSMFGTLEAVLASLADMPLTKKWRREFHVGLVCVTSFLIGICMVTSGGSYVVELFDQFAGSLTLLVIGLGECIAVAYVYRINRFSARLKVMTGRAPAMYWKVCWKYVSPIIMTLLFFGSIGYEIYEPPTYQAYNQTTNETRDKQFPGWAEFIGSVLILLSVVQIPLLAFLNRPPNWKRALPAFLRSCCSESLRRRRDNDEVPLEDSDEVQAVAYRQMDDVQA